MVGKYIAACFRINMRMAGVSIDGSKMHDLMCSCTMGVTAAMEQAANRKIPVFGELKLTDLTLPLFLFRGVTYKGNLLACWQAHP